MQDQWQLITKLQSNQKECSKNLLSLTKKYAKCLATSILSNVRDKSNMCCYLLQVDDVDVSFVSFLTANIKKTLSSELSSLPCSFMILLLIQNNFFFINNMERDKEDHFQCLVQSIDTYFNDVKSYATKDLVQGKFSKFNASKFKKCIPELLKLVVLS